MDRNGKSEVKEPLNAVVSQNGGLRITEKEDEESQLLLPSKKGGLSKKSGKPRMKVQWNDRNGDKLAEVLEFQPSDVSDSDEEDADACFCRIIMMSSTNGIARTSICRNFKGCRSPHYLTSKSKVFQDKELMSINGLLYTKATEDDDCFG